MTFTDAFKSFDLTKEVCDTNTIKKYITKLRQIDIPVVSSHNFVLGHKAFAFVPYEFFICAKCMSCFVASEFGYISPVVCQTCPAIQGIGNGKISLATYICSKCGAYAVGHTSPILTQNPTLTCNEHIMFEVLQ